MNEYLTFFANHPIMMGIWLVLFFALIYNLMQSKFAAFGRVNTQQLTQLINKQDAVVVDIRPDADYKKGHITGAKLLSPQQIEQETLKGLEKSKQNPIIVVCQTGMTAGKSATKLAQSGFEQVNILDGGMTAWTSANLPVAKG
ncbi:rhodanese-like domain-containing protein [Catenovulum sp. SM1970]|uniref:rhodanese-like domain-containing protein n=1 Tax=Marinifaba aquimaris TaxID=2741323 RepID=UPI001572B7A2|nr:rhodanese-like domain-containing protein [Marinifaba aquimaris]NTS77231.1 rhodanese-like domain-containing protein [Marinifaba aquimaris]